MKNPNLIETVDYRTNTRKYKIPKGTPVSIKRMTDVDWNNNHTTTKDLLFEDKDCLSFITDDILILRREYNNIVWLLQIKRFIVYA